MKIELNTLYQKLSPEIIEYQKFDGSTMDYFLIFITSALGKSIEFNCIVNSVDNEEISLLLTPNLRGITEDIIALSFIDKFITRDRNVLLHQKTMLQQMQILKQQKGFFDEYKPEQIIYDVDDKEEKLQQYKNQFKEIMSLNGFENLNDLPNTREMAQHVGLLRIYDFIFRASSEFVHFNPHILLRMGWLTGENSKTYLSSTKHFSKYYAKFNSFYGSFLLIKFIKSFDHYFAFTETIKSIFLEIEMVIMKEFEFPELITLEEMNVENAQELRLINQIRAIKRNISARESNKTE